MKGSYLYEVTVNNRRWKVSMYPSGMLRIIQREAHARDGSRPFRTTWEYISFEARREWRGRHWPYRPSGTSAVAAAKALELHRAVRAKEREDERAAQAIDITPKDIRERRRITTIPVDYNEDRK